MTVQVAGSPESTRLTAAQRVLSILGIFNIENAALSLTEISRRTGLTLSTTHRLVNELREWGALSRGTDGRYSIGLRILELGTVSQELRLREVALPFLEKLQRAVRANVHLAVADGHDVIYIESLRSLDGVPVLSRLGGRWPMHATGTGLVLLANASKEFQEEVLSSRLRSFTEYTPTDPDGLRSRLAEIRRSGVAIIENQLTYDARAIAVPIRGPQDRVVAAVGLTTPTDSPSPYALVPALVRTARAISRALGAPSAASAERRPGLAPSRIAAAASPPGQEDRVDRADRADHADQAGQANQAAQAGQADQANQAAQADQADQANQEGRANQEGWTTAVPDGGQCAGDRRRPQEHEHEHGTAGPDPAAATVPARPGAERIAHGLDRSAQPPADAVHVRARGSTEVLGEIAPQHQHQGQHHADRAHTAAGGPVRADPVTPAMPAEPARRDGLKRHPVTRPRPPPCRSLPAEASDDAQRLGSGDPGRRTAPP